VIAKPAINEEDELYLSYLNKKVSNLRNIYKQTKLDAVFHEKVKRNIWFREARRRVKNGAEVKDIQEGAIYLGEW